jgi:hypothetical protein
LSEEKNLNQDKDLPLGVEVNDPPVNNGEEVPLQLGQMINRPDYTGDKVLCTVYQSKEPKNPPYYAVYPGRHSEPPMSMLLLNPAHPLYATWTEEQCRLQEERRTAPEHPAGESLPVEVAEPILQDLKYVNLQSPKITPPVNLSKDVSEETVPLISNVKYSRETFKQLAVQTPPPMCRLSLGW